MFCILNEVDEQKISAKRVQDRKSESYEGVNKMSKLIAIGIMFLILFAFVSPALAADTTRAEPNYKIYTLEQNEDTAKLLESLGEKQNVMVYDAESEEDLIKIATTLSEDFGVDGKELIGSIEQSIEQPSDRASTDLLENLQGSSNIDQFSIIIRITSDSITIIIIW
jgi:hypothetical protein